MSRFAFLWRRSIVADVIQGVIVGGILAFITFQGIAIAHVTAAGGWTTVYGCGKPGDSDLQTAHSLAQQMTLTPAPVAKGIVQGTVLRDTGI